MFTSDLLGVHKRSQVKRQIADWQRADVMGVVDTRNLWRRHLCGDVT